MSWMIVIIGAIPALCLYNMDIRLNQVYTLPTDETELKCNYLISKSEKDLVKDFFIFNFESNSENSSFIIITVNKFYS